MERILCKYLKMYKKLKKWNYFRKKEETDMVNFTSKNSNYAIVFLLQKGYHKKWKLGHYSFR